MVTFVEFLCRYVSPEHVPIQYGGLSVDYCDCNPEFTIDDPAAVVTVKPATKQTVEIIVNEVLYIYLCIGLLFIFLLNVHAIIHYEMNFFSFALRKFIRRPIPTQVSKP